MKLKANNAITSAISVIVVISIFFAIGFGLSLIDRSPSQPGWLTRACLSGVVLVAALIPIGLFCSWLAAVLPFSPRIKGAIVMATGFALFRLAFHLAGLSEEPLLKSLGSGAMLGTLVGEFDCRW